MFVDQLSMLFYPASIYFYSSTAIKQTAAKAETENSEHAEM